MINFANQLGTSRKPCTFSQNNKKIWTHLQRKSYESTNYKANANGDEKILVLRLTHAVDVLATFFDSSVEETCTNREARIKK